MDRVRVLLQTHDEAYDGAISRLESAGSLSGFGDPRERLYSCGVCGGQGCPRCERGRVMVAERDPYDNGDTGFWAKPEAKTMSAQEIEWALARLREIELERTRVMAHVDFEGSLKQAEARDLRGSYAELRYQLGRMPTAMREDHIASVRWLAAYMRGAIRVPRWALEVELRGMGSDVLAASDAGWSVSEIAENLSIPKRQVRSLLRLERSRKP